MNVLWLYYTSLQIISYPIVIFHTISFASDSKMETLSFEQFASHITAPTTHYDLINRYSTDQIDENSSDRAVRTATRQALRVLHSDKTADYDKELFLQVSAVKDLLCDELERERYNVDVDAAKANHRDKIDAARVLYEEEIKKEKERVERLRLEEERLRQEEEDVKHKLWKQERERKKNERKTKRSPDGNNKKKKTRGKHFESLLVAYLSRCH